VNVCDGEDSHRVGLVDTPLLGPRTEPTTKFILHRRVPKRDPLALSCRVACTEMSPSTLMSKRISPP